MKRNWWSIKAEAGADEATVYIYDRIGGGLFSDGVSAKEFVQELAALDVKTIALRINSPGGSVFEGTAIANALQRHPAKVTAYVDGVAASIASVIALAGERVVMAANALYMIHDPSIAAMGTAKDLRQAAELLDQIAGTIRATYITKSGMDEADLIEAMAAETWYTAAQALEAGFADEVGEVVAAAAGVQAFDLAELGYKNAPAATLIVPALPTKDSTATTGAESAGVEAAEAKPTPPKLVLVGDRLVSFTDPGSR